jgi:hypothetical protein
VPVSGLAGNVFLSAYALLVSVNLPGGLQNIQPNE